MDKRVVITALVSAIGGGAIGGVVTYLTVKKTFAERAQRDIDEVKQAYHDKFDGKRVINEYVDMPGPDDPSDVAPQPLVATAEDIQRARDFVASLGYTDKAVEDAREEQTVSIYEHHVEDPEGEEVEDIRLVGYSWDDRKKNGKPYLISEKEFYETKTEWDKLSITYFEGDDVLTDTDDKPVDDIDYLIGEVHLDFFGLRATDKNQVFVRCPQISTDYEVTRNLSTYTSVILNLQEGNETVGTRRFRGDDE